MWLCVYRTCVQVWPYTTWNVPIINMQISWRKVTKTALTWLTTITRSSPAILIQFKSSYFAQNHFISGFARSSATSVVLALPNGSSDRSKRIRNSNWFLDHVNAEHHKTPATTWRWRNEPNLHVILITNTKWLPNWMLLRNVL